jgi:predicted ester cyclase
VQTFPSLIRRIFDQAFNQGDLAIVDELLSVDVTTHLAGWGLPASRLGLKQMIANLRSAFPDLLCTVEDEIGEGDKYAAHWTMRGTHQGSLFGNLPTGRPVAVQGFIFARTANGQIVEDWILIDQMGMLQQLGIVPPPRGNV